jgi:hypothetical protein
MPKTLKSKIKQIHKKLKRCFFSVKDLSFSYRFVLGALFFIFLFIDIVFVRNTMIFTFVSFVLFVALCVNFKVRRAHIIFLMLLILSILPFVLSLKLFIFAEKLAMWVFMCFVVGGVSKLMYLKSKKFNLHD